MDRRGPGAPWRSWCSPLRSRLRSLPCWRAEPARRSTARAQAGEAEWSSCCSPTAHPGADSDRLLEQTCMEVADRDVATMLIAGTAVVVAEKRAPRGAVEPNERPAARGGLLRGPA